MDEFIITSDELKQMFKEKKIIDTNNGWFYNDKEVEILAVHNIDVKYIQDMANAENYKIKFK